MLKHITDGVEHIYLACGVTDFRKQIPGLTSLVQSRFQLDPYAPVCLFLFCNLPSDTESYQREKDWLENGCNVFHERKDNQSRPLSFWTDKDIHEYINRFDVKIPSLYNMGYSRNGCMYCGFGVHLEPKGSNRYQKLKKTHPKQYTYFIENFGSLMIDFEVAVA